jgi:choline-sulfatase
MLSFVKKPASLFDVLRLFGSMCVLAALLTLAWSRTASPKPDVVIVMIDTLRFDRLGLYDSTRDVSPFLDSLAERGYVFHRAYAQAPWTNPSIGTLFTSRYPSQHGVDSFAAVLPANEVTLAEVLSQNGYATGAFNANFLLRRKNGFAQGFERFAVLSRSFVGPNGERQLNKGRAPQVHEAALAWLDEIAPTAGPGSPVFLYLQYMEPHVPYDPPENFIAQVLQGRPRPSQQQINDRIHLAVGPVDDETMQGVEIYYDAEVKSLDSDLRSLFSALETRGLLENTIVVITADHGEELHEHGRMGHTQTLYEEVIRVPLIVLVPGHTRRTDISAPVSLIDVAPTILDLIGIPPVSSFEGRSLVQRFDLGDGASWLARLMSSWRSSEAETAVFSELIKQEGMLRLMPHERAVIVGNQKLVVNVNGTSEYYDLARDPGEKDAQTQPPDGNQPSRALERFSALAPEPARPSAQKTIDENTLERMRALGYAE